MKPILWFLILLLNINLKAHAKIWYVTTSGAGNKDGSNRSHALDNLQTALTNANSGDTIWVVKGKHIPQESMSSYQNNSNGRFLDYRRT